MSYPDSRQIISLVTKYANEGNEFHLNKIVLFLTMNFDRTETGHPHDLPIEQKRTWLKEHDIFAIVKFRYVIKCVVVLFYLFTFLPYRQGYFGPLMYDYFVEIWADTMTYEEGYFFMATHARKEVVIKHWVKNLPSNAMKLLPRSSEDINIVNFPMDFRQHAVKWLTESRKEQSLQGRCRELIQTSVGDQEIDNLPLPRIIREYLKDIEPTRCFKVLKDIEHILTIEYYVEDLFTV